MESMRDKLLSLTQNLWWTWRPEVRAIFHELDAGLYTRGHRNPVEVLRDLDAAQIEERIRDTDLPSRIDRARRQLTEYLNPVTTWGLTRAGALRSRPVVYFSAEFGLHECIPIYSGGLGILAGDYLKGASDLGVPLVGVGLLYREGYVHQVLDKDFWQQDVTEPFYVKDLPLEMANSPDGKPSKVGVELPGRTVFLRIQMAEVGRVRLLLLDTNDPENDPVDQKLAARLYGGDQRTRIQQELLLGVGGMRALRHLGITPSALHLNEGHSAFAILEWARQKVATCGVEPRKALREAAASTVFTTHTPVEAGHDRFPPGLVEDHLRILSKDLGLPLDEVVGLGRVNAQNASDPFLPTVLALRYSRRANGVSALHGAVSREMWHVLWPDRAGDDIPIGHVTNGVHLSTWLAPEMQDIYSTRLAPNWNESLAHPSTWTPIESIDPGELWEARQILKARTLRFIREQVGKMRERLEMPPLDPVPLQAEALTIGFARRFVPYKRPDLLFTDLSRLAALLNHQERPVNLVFSGRAHPADQAGKALIQKVARLAEDPRFNHRIAFVEGHNIHVGRQLYQGVDAWLNTPQRPMEACGTSGMKAVMNGVLHISVLDGWWAEAFDGENGFAIGNGEAHVNPEIQSQRDAENLFRLLEEEVIPLYYARDEHGIPRRWIQRMKRSIRTLAWRFTADRMVMDYVKELYLPAALASSCEMPSP